MTYIIHKKKIPQKYGEPWPLTYVINGPKKGIAMSPSNELNHSYNCGFNSGANGNGYEMVMALYEQQTPIDIIWNFKATVTSLKLFKHITPASRKCM